MHPLIFFFAQDGLSMTDKIKQGMKIEISDVLHPYKLWVATVRTQLQKSLKKRVFHYKSVL